MNFGLDLIIGKEAEPTSEEQLMFFFLDKGIGYNEFISYPIPYILAMYEVAVYNKTQQEKRQK